MSGSGFHWGANRKLAEVTAVEELVKVLRSMGRRVCPVWPREETKPVATPPDCFANSPEGGLLGFEVTELTVQREVQGRLISENIQRRARGESECVVDWTLDLLIHSIESILAEKDGKLFAGGPYRSRVLVITTDEFTLGWGMHVEELEAHEFGPLAQLDEAYLLWSWDPSSRSHPVARLV